MLSRETDDVFQLERVKAPCCGGVIVMYTVSQLIVDDVRPMISWLGMSCDVVRAPRANCLDARDNVTWLAALLGLLGVLVGCHGALLAGANNCNLSVDCTTVASQHVTPFLCA
jgi:hypothetical protein